MRKCSVKRVIALAAILLMLAPAAFAAESPSVTAFRVASPVVIDGVIDDQWNVTSPVVIDSEEQIVRDPHMWQGPMDASLKAYLAWDEDNLYIAAEVAEDSPFGAIDMLPMDGKDNFELYLSTNPKDDPERKTYSATDFRVFFALDGEYWDTAIDRSMVADHQRFVSKGMDGGENVLDGFECAAVKNASGFIYEAKIPWECFSNQNIARYTPQAGDTVKFDFLITDIGYPCPGTQYIPQLAWTGDANINTDPSLWGNLVFSD
ncbi:MAG: hypothetical protein KHX34_08435 [Clostridiales bacterium]|nr:hypothetical protein [Clostridiales bacterium]